MHIVGKLGFVTLLIFSFVLVEAGPITEKEVANSTVSTYVNKTNEEKAIDAVTDDPVMNTVKGAYSVNNDGSPVCLCKTLAPAPQKCESWPWKVVLMLLGLLVMLFAFLIVILGPVPAENDRCLAFGILIGIYMIGLILFFIGL